MNVASDRAIALTRVLRWLLSVSLAAAGSLALHWLTPLYLDTFPGDPPPDLPLVPGGREPTWSERRVLRALRGSYAGMFDYYRATDVLLDWRYRNAGEFATGGTGYGGKTHTSEKLAWTFRGELALLITLLTDPAPVVRAYAAIYLAESDHPAAPAALERGLADDGRMHCMSGCEVYNCVVWEAVESNVGGYVMDERGFVLDDDGRPTFLWPGSIATVARGSGVAAARAASLEARYVKSRMNVTYQETLE